MQTAEKTNLNDYPGREKVLAEWQRLVDAGETDEALDVQQFDVHFGLQAEMPHSWAKTSQFLRKGAVRFPETGRGLWSLDFPHEYVEGQEGAKARRVIPWKAIRMGAAVLLVVGAVAAREFWFQESMAKERETIQLERKAILLDQNHLNTKQEELIEQQLRLLSAKYPGPPAKAWSQTEETSAEGGEE